VASGDMALVQRVSQATGQRIADACVPERGELNLLDKPEVFAQLRAAGFTGEQGACARDAAPLPQRIVSQLLHSRQLIVARRGEVVPMLQWVNASKGALDAVLDNGQTPLIAAIQLGREDLADAMLSAGAQPDLADAAGRSPAWVALETGQPGMLALLARHHARFDNASAPPGQTFSYTLACQSAPAFAEVLQDAGVSLTAKCAPPAPAPRGSAKAASKSADASGLPGHYSLRGVREVGSELLLSQDGRFDYIMSYGAVDISARGTWRSDGKQVFLDTPPIQPDSPIAAVRGETGAASSDPLTVRVYYRDRPVKIDVAMSSSDADYGGGPRSSEGADGVTAPIAPGTLKALSVFLPLPSGARWHQVDISKLDAGARAIRIDVEVPESAAGTPMHKTFTRHKDGALVESNAGRELRYEKE